MRELTAEEFLREKLENEISQFGDGTTEFHTRDIQHLLQCLDKKDSEIHSSKEQCIELITKINWNAEERFKELLDLVMTRSIASSEERLYYIRKEYKDIWDKLQTDSKK